MKNCASKDDVAECMLAASLGHLSYSAQALLYLITASCVWSSSDFYLIDQHTTVTVNSEKFAFS